MVGFTILVLAVIAGAGIIEVTQHYADKFNAKDAKVAAANKGYEVRIKAAMDTTKKPCGNHYQFVERPFATGKFGLVFNGYVIGEDFTSEEIAKFHEECDKDGRCTLWRTYKENLPDYRFADFGPSPTVKACPADTRKSLNHKHHRQKRHGFLHAFLFI